MTTTKATTKMTTDIEIRPSLEQELRRRAGIVSEFGAPLRFATPPRRPWWQFW